MTTADSRATTRTQPRIVFPDPPEHRPDNMTSFNHLAATGSVYHLIQHFGNPETTLVAGEHYLSPEPRRSIAGLKVPDLLIAFDVDPAAYEASNAYVISEQGKPPDFVLEVASPSTGRADVTVKREAYAALGIAEYWRFDETGEFHGARLAGDRLAGGSYEPILIEALAEDVLQGHSAALDLYLRWERGQLTWHDPATGRHIATLETEREARIREQIRAESAEIRADNAETRVRELEAELRRLRGS